MKNLTEKANILKLQAPSFIKIPSYLHKNIKIINQNTCRDRNDNC